MNCLLVQCRAGMSSLKWGIQVLTWVGLTKFEEWRLMFWIKWYQKNCWMYWASWNAFFELIDHRSPVAGDCGTLLFPLEGSLMAKKWTHITKDKCQWVLEWLPFTARVQQAETAQQKYLYFWHLLAYFHPRTTVCSPHIFRHFCVFKIAPIFRWMHSALLESTSIQISSLEIPRMEGDWLQQRISQKESPYWKYLIPCVFLRFRGIITQIGLDSWKNWILSMWWNTKSTRQISLQPSICCSPFEIQLRSWSLTLDTSHTTSLGGLQFGKLKTCKRWTPLSMPHTLSTRDSSRQPWMISEELGRHSNRMTSYGLCVRSLRGHGLATQEIIYFSFLSSIWSIMSAVHPRYNGVPPLWNFLLVDAAKDSRYWWLTVKAAQCSSSSVMDSLNRWNMLILEESHLVHDRHSLKKTWCWTRWDAQSWFHTMSYQEHTSISSTLDFQRL